MGLPRTVDGRLRVTTDAIDAAWQHGLLRSPDGALVVAFEPLDGDQRGWPRAASGALSVDAS